jgi:hypothetical protein
MIAAFPLTIRRALPLLLIAAAIVLAGCGGSVKDRILGKWANPGGATIEFLEDGTYISQGLMSAQGRYTILSDERIKLESRFLGMDGAQVYKVQFESDTVTFIGPGGGTLRRVN